MDEIKSNILFASFKLFLVKGYKEVSLNDIANEVNLTKGSLYHYFSSKEEIFSEITDVYLFDALNRFRNIALIDNLSPRLKISLLFKKYAGFIDEVVKYVGNEENIYGYYLLLFEATRRIPKVKERLGSIYAEIRSGIEKMIKEGIAKGDYKTDIDAKTMSIHIFSILEGSNLMWIYDRNIDYHDYFLKIEEQVADMLMK